MDSNNPLHLVTLNHIQDVIFNAMRQRIPLDLIISSLINRVKNQPDVSGYTSLVNAIEDARKMLPKHTIITRGLW